MNVKVKIGGMRMTPEEAKRAYHKKWRDSHRDRIKEYNKRYWEKKAAEAEQEMKQKDGRTEN